MDIGGWLRSLGLEKYEAAFRENEIDDTVLPNLTAEDLKDLGVGIVGHRRKLLDAIAALHSEAEAKAALTEAPQTGDRSAKDTAERRQVTVMFSDLVGSTALAARMDPEDLREVISAYQKCVAETVRRFGGFVAKYMGDGVLVYFGYPQAHEDDAERAVRAGLELVAAVNVLKTSPLLQTRVGVATGLVVVGDLIGSGEAQERGIVGETPNLAARLQSIAEPNTVVIAESTRKLLGNLFELHDLGARELKGIAEPVRSWAALRASGVESRFEALRTATTTLVGRDEEIELLIRRWAQAKAGEGSAVLISGEPGIGKSRLAEAMQEQLATEPHTRVRFFCSPYHQDSALYPAIAQLERAAGFRREDPAEQRLTKLEALLAQATNDISGVAPLFADLLSIPTGDRYPALALTPQKRKEKTLQALIAQSEGLALRHPVLMIFEDIHWSDPTTRELLDLLIERVPKVRLLVLITYRPEFSPAWVGRPHVTLLTLSSLPPRQRSEMIIQMTGGKALPREITNRIVERTDGVPLFIEELTKAVIESGVVTDAGDRYTAADVAPSLAIPASLHASLLARLDRLAPTREVAQIGATLGRSFSHELISAVADMPHRVLDDALDQLVRAELIFRRGTPPNAEYAFKHALVQDAAYSTLLRSRRQQLHGRIAAALESQFTEMVGAQPQLMAHHYAEAGLTDKAISYSLKAGQQMMARSAMPEAVSQLQKGLVLVTSLPVDSRQQQLELDLQVSTAQALLVTKGYAASAVAEAYGRARSLAEQLNRRDYLPLLLHGLWAFHLVRDELKLSATIAEQMEILGQEGGNTTASLIAKEEHGISCFWRGDFDTARALFERCHGLNEPAHRAMSNAWSVQDQYNQTLIYLAAATAFLGHVAEGRARLSEALTHAKELKHPFTSAFALSVAAIFESIVGSHRAAERYAAELAAISTEHGFPFYVAWANLFQGRSLAALGQSNEGFKLITNSLPMMRATGAVLGAPLALMMLAEVNDALGQPSVALNCVAEAVQIIEANDERWLASEVFRLRGRLLKAGGDLAAAEDSYSQAVAITREQRAKLFELRAATDLARLWRDQGKRSEARDFSLRSTAGSPRASTRSI